MKTVMQKCLLYTLALVCAGVLSSCGSKSHAKPEVEIPQVKVPGKGPKSEGCRPEAIQKLQAASDKAWQHQSNVEFTLNYLKRKSEDKLTQDQAVLVQLMLAELAGAYGDAVVAATEAATQLTLKIGQCALE